MKFATAIAATIATLGLLASPAAADMPANVHAGRAGALDAGWVRVQCATSDDSARCAIRVPAGYSRLDLHSYRGSEWLSSDKSWAYPTARRTYAAPKRMRGQVAPGVRVRCVSRGSFVSCRFRYAKRIHAYNLSLWSAGTNQGGPVHKGF